VETKKIAKGISIICQPTFIPIALYFIVSLSVVPTVTGIWYALLGIVFIALAPIALVFILARCNKISDPDLPDRRERFIPYLSIVGLYLIGFIVFWYLGAPYQILAITVSYIAVTLFGAFISLFWKISMHMAGVAGPVTALVFLVNPLFVWAYILLIPIGWARYILKKHTFPQIVIGSGFSILLTYLVIRFFS
jgi:small-conductance mechanosensitive channel